MSGLRKNLKNLEFWTLVVTFVGTLMTMLSFFYQVLSEKSPKAVYIVEDPSQKEFSLSINDDVSDNEESSSDKSDVRPFFEKNGTYLMLFFSVLSFVFVGWVLGSVFYSLKMTMYYLVSSFLFFYSVEASGVDYYDRQVIISLYLIVGYLFIFFVIVFSVIDFMRKDNQIIRDFKKSLIDSEALVISNINPGKFGDVKVKFDGEYFIKCARNNSQEEYKSGDVLTIVKTDADDGYLEVDKKIGV